MSDEDDGTFDEIINNQPDDIDGMDDDSELGSMWDAIEHLWPHFYPGQLLVKGVQIYEYLDENGERSLKWNTSSQVSPWELLGLANALLLDARDIYRGSREYADDEDEGPQ